MNSKLKVTSPSVINYSGYECEPLILYQTADPLFNGNVWQNAWWSRWGSEFDLKIILVNGDEGTICKLPLYIDSFKFKHIIPLKRLQFIGTNYQNIITPRAEYLSFLGVKGFESALMFGLDAIEFNEWDEFVARDIEKGGQTDKTIAEWAEKNKWLVRVIHTDTAYSISTNLAFESYKRNLGASTRLKLFNRRKLLETLGDVAIENYYPNRVAEFFNLLNEFHEKRWGDTYSQETLSFHHEIIKSAKPGRLEVELSVLKVNDVCESVMFNYILNGRAYNISSGFNESFHKKIAVGMLHLGFMIESSFQNSSIDTFDLLAGGGKNSDYKARIATDRIELHSIQVVSSSWLKVLYIINDGIKNLNSLFLTLKTNLITRYKQ